MPNAFSKWMGEAVCGDTKKLQRELSAQLGPEQALQLENAIAKLEADKEEIRDIKLREAIAKKEAAAPSKDKAKAPKK